jgi:tetratricopeptide (TPR) repeat protein
MNEKQSDLAKRYFGKAISASPDYPDAFYNLALLEMQSGEHAAADRHWRRYLDLDDHSAWAENARRGLQLLRLLSEGQEPQNVPEMKRGNSWTS